MASKLPEELGMPAVIDSKIVEEIAGRFTFRGGIGDAVLTNERRNQISELIFTGGWVKFVDQFDNEISLFEIPNLTFLSCDAKALNIPYENSIFEHCTNCTDLRRVVFPNLTFIDRSMFLNCHSLTRVDIPRLEYVSHDAFKYCSQLETIDLSKVTEIKEEAFMGCRKLSNINMPRLRGKLGSGAFMGCIRLTSVKLHLVESIGESAFRDCINLQRIDLPEALIIEQRAFERCKSLTDVHIPKVSHISHLSFRECENLRRIELPSLQGIIDFQIGHSVERYSAIPFFKSPTEVFVTQKALDRVKKIREKLEGKVRLLGTERPSQRRRTQFKNLRL